MAVTSVKRFGLYWALDGSGWFISLEDLPNLGARDNFLAIQLYQVHISEQVAALGNIGTKKCFGIDNNPHRVSAASFRDGTVIEKIAAISSMRRFRNIMGKLMDEVSSIAIPEFDGNYSTFFNSLSWPSTPATEI